MGEILYRSHLTGLNPIYYCSVGHPKNRFDDPNGSSTRARRRIYVRDGQRLCGYDNERGKGDHKHLLGEEFPYRFRDVETVVADFRADVQTVAREVDEDE